MLRLPPFSFERPARLDEALELLAAHGTRARVVAGGTDLMPNLKHGLYDIDAVIGLAGLDELRGVEVAADGTVSIGAMTTLAHLVDDADVKARLPGLSQAVATVAGPTQREMGTIGGNVCLDTRCVYINQTHFWRKALGYCLKKDGTVCHVIEKGRKCVAAASNDSATMLVAMDAVLEIAHRDATREVAIRDFYHSDGTYNLKLEPGELLTTIRVPAQPERHHSGYAKLRTRNSIDFPKLSVAVRYALGDAGTMTNCDLVISAIAAVPRRIKQAARVALGKRPDDAEFLAELGATAQKSTHPLTNIDGDTEWRREMIPVFVRRAFAAAAAAS